jgi:DNA-binding FrmR family transcriptional regulator
MLDERGSKEIARRLRKIEGQVRGLQRMIEEGRYCMEVLQQLTSVVAALRQVERIMLRQHLETCVSEAIRHGPNDEQRRKLDEVMKYFTSQKR